MEAAPFLFSWSATPCVLAGYFLRLFVGKVWCRGNLPLAFSSSVAGLGGYSMTAFIIGQMQIHSRDWMEEYFAKIPKVVEAHSGEFLVRGGEPEMMEGSDPLPDAAFILEFPDRAHAQRFWNSDEFQRLAILRRSGSTLNAILVDKLA
ncbi:DUF1330 domain-containing protein [Phaeobacter sp. JL2872]|nr:DUF1330 domain-containing protein [Phaeobacter sp. JL2872]